MTTGRDLRIETPRGSVSASLTRAARGGPLVLVAHGAGGHKDDPMLVAFAEGLAQAGVGCLRFNFPYRERGARAPDPAPVLIQAWRAVFERGREIGDPVWVGGKSLGGRMASVAVAEGMPAAGIVFLGYPLHPPGRPERLRDAHLDDVKVPMLFLQGTGDAFARWDLLEAVVRRLGRRALLHPIEGGDHSFRVRGRKRDPAATGMALARVAAAFVLERR